MENLRGELLLPNTKHIYHRFGNAPLEEARVIGLGEIHNFIAIEKDLLNFLSNELREGDVVLMEGTAWDTQVDPDKYKIIKGLQIPGVNFEGWEEPNMDKIGEETTLRLQVLILKTIREQITDEERAELRELNSTFFSLGLYDRTKYGLIPSIINNLASHNRVFVIAGKLHFEDEWFHDVIKEVPYVVYSAELEMPE